MAGKSLSSVVGKLQLQDSINPWHIFATVSNDHILHHNFVFATFTWVELHPLPFLLVVDLMQHGPLNGWLGNYDWWAPILTHLPVTLKIVRWIP